MRKCDVRTTMNRLAKGPNQKAFVKYLMRGKVARAGWYLIRVREAWRLGAEGKLTTASWWDLYERLTAAGVEFEFPAHWDPVRYPNGFPGSPWSYPGSVKVKWD